jgi:hypothetical protein
MTHTCHECECKCFVWPLPQNYPCSMLVHLQENLCGRLCRILLSFVSCNGPAIWKTCNYIQYRHPASIFASAYFCEEQPHTLLFLTREMDYDILCPCLGVPTNKEPVVLCEFAVDRIKELYLFPPLCPLLQIPSSLQI